MSGVRVVCDSPRHVRGKVAVVAEYAVGEDGTVVLVPVKVRRTRRVLRQARVAADGAYGGPGTLEAAQAAQRAVLDGKGAPACKLCGQRIPADRVSTHAVIAECSVPGRDTTIALSQLRSRVGSIGRQ